MNEYDHPPSPLIAIAFSGHGPPVAPSPPTSHGDAATTVLGCGAAGARRVARRRPGFTAAKSKETGTGKGNVLPEETPKQLGMQLGIIGLCLGMIG